MDELYDIYGVIYNPFWKTKWFYFSVGLLILIILAIGVWLILSRKKKYTIGDEALLELKKLSVDSKEYKKFYFTLSAILKKYLGFRYNCNLTSKTDEEVYEVLKNSMMPLKLVRILDEILKGAVTIKFANDDSSKKQMEHDLNSAIFIINETIL